MSNLIRMHWVESSAKDHLSLAGEFTALCSLGIAGYLGLLIL